jgi:hypothetical protein
MDVSVSAIGEVSRGGIETEVVSPEAAGKELALRALFGEMKSVLVAFSAASIVPTWPISRRSNWARVRCA